MIKCPKCGHLEDNGMNFCSSCGAKLVKSCPECHASNAMANQICVECGTRMDASVKDSIVIEEKEVLVIKEIPQPRNDNEAAAKRIEESKAKVEQRKKRTIAAFQWVAFGMIAFFLVLTFSLIWFSWIEASSYGYTNRFISHVYESHTNDISLVSMFGPLFNLSSNPYLDPEQVNSAMVLVASNVILMLGVLTATVVLAILFIIQISKRDFSLNKFKKMFVKYTVFLVFVAAISPFNGYSFEVPLVFACVISVFLLIVSYILEKPKQTKSKTVLNTIAFAGIIILWLVSVGASYDLTFTGSISSLIPASGAYEGFGIVALITNMALNAGRLGAANGDVTYISTLTAISYLTVVATAVFYAILMIKVVNNPYTLDKKMGGILIAVIAMSFITFAMNQSLAIISNEYFDRIRARISFEGFNWFTYSPFVISAVGILHLVSYIKDNKVQKQA